MVLSMYKIQEISKSNLIQIAGVYILSGSAEIISDWIPRYIRLTALIRVKAGLMSGYVLSSSEHSV